MSQKIMHKLTGQRSACLAAVVAALAIATLIGQIEAATANCPLDNGSCKEYCQQQGCSVGNCGQFAWIECICRKCGDEWNQYDKIHYKPDVKVNQTQLESLKLNSSSLIILTNSTENSLQQQQQEEAAATAAPREEPAKVLSISSVDQASNGATANMRSIVIRLPPSIDSTSRQQQQQQQPQNDDVLEPATKQEESTDEASNQQQQRQQATLTTLLFPEVSDQSGEDDPMDESNEVAGDDIPDKFLDYLAALRASLKKP